MIKFFLSFIFLSGASIGGLFGQDLPSIQTDRPDQTETPFIVPKRHFQIENGFNFEKASGRETIYLYPGTLWKYGVNDIFELRLITELITTNVNGVSASGLTPVRIGFKTNFIKGKGIIPMTSFIGHISIPALSTKEFRTAYYAPGFLFTMQNTLTDKIHTGYNLGAKWDGESPEPIFLYSWSTGFEITPKIEPFVEIYGFIPQGGHAEHSSRFGFSYHLKSNILLDLANGFGLNENATEYYLSIGISLRLPD
jgi:hypothetical protein